MPLYEYKCKNEHISECWCKFSDKPKTVKCEKCGEEAQPTVTSSFGFSFKTKGFSTN